MHRVGETVMMKNEEDLVGIDLEDSQDKEQK
jgi:hypothetical protein